MNIRERTNESSGRRTVKFMRLLVLTSLCCAVWGCADYYGPAYGPGYYAGASYPPRYYGPGYGYGYPGYGYGYPGYGSVAIEIGDRPYYTRGPGYWVGRSYYVWKPGHWAVRHGQRVWVHGHYVRKG